MGILFITWIMVSILVMPKFPLWFYWLLLNIDTLISFRFFSWPINLYPLACFVRVSFEYYFVYIFATLVAILACSALLDEIFSCFFYLVLLVMLSRHQFFVIFLLVIKDIWLNFVSTHYLTLTVCLSIALLFYLLCFATLVATLLCLMQYWQALLHLM